MQFITPANWTDYELIDSGGFEKLERYGDYILRRPEPQAIWDKSMSNSEWIVNTDAAFVRSDKGASHDENERGEWRQKKDMPGQWFVSYKYKEMNLKFRLGLTSFKHVGLFPEQAENWNFIYDSTRAIENPTVLNLFAYTGGASLAAKAGGADVTHVDSVKQVISWSKENMQASGLDNIRWVIEDAMKYVKREVRREKKYNGIILDPPAYGRGPEGEKWILESHLNELLHSCNQLLSTGKHFVVLNLYSMGFSPLIAENLVKTCFPSKNVESGEFLFVDKGERKLPLGIFSRYKNF